VKLTTIRARIRLLEKQAEKIESAYDKRLSEVAKLIAKHSLSLEDWKRAFSLSKKSPRKLKAANGRANPRKGKRVPVKYSDGKGNKWSGRGRLPLWLAAAEKAGKKRETFLVKAA
jgi:DNA-binding protein H-NS